MEILILKNNIQHGPYPEEQVREFLKAGQLSPDDMSWTKGISEWIPLSQLLPENNTQPITQLPLTLSHAEQASTAASCENSTTTTSLQQTTQEPRNLERPILYSLVLILALFLTIEKSTTPTNTQPSNTPTNTTTSQQANTKQTGINWIGELEFDGGRPNCLIGIQMKLLRVVTDENLISSEGRLHRFDFDGAKKSSRRAIACRFHINNTTAKKLESDRLDFYAIDNVGDAYDSKTSVEDNLPVSVDPRFKVSGYRVFLLPTDRTLTEIKWKSPYKRNSDNEQLFATVNFNEATPPQPSASSKVNPSQVSDNNTTPTQPTFVPQKSTYDYAAEEERKWLSGGRARIIKETLEKYHSNPVLKNLPEDSIIKSIDDNYKKTRALMYSMGVENFRAKYGDSPER